ncbi:MAG: DUF4153 domain-containing protein [Robiginitomaculum sp.]
MPDINPSEKLSDDLTTVFKRFPLAVLMAVLLTIAVLYCIQTRPDYAQALRLYSGPVLAGYVSLIFSLANEGREKPASKLLHIGAVLLALLACYFHEALRFNPWMAITAAVLYLGSAPFFRRGDDATKNVKIWDFTHRIWTGVIFTVLGSILFALGLMFIVEAMKKLFGFNIKDLAFDWLMPIALSGLAPLYWMSTIADPRTELDDSLRNPSFISRAIAFMGVWLLAPLVLIFAVILLAYLVKIISNGALPDGETALLVTPFLIIGTLTWLILDPPFIREKWLAKTFRAVWFWAMIPAAILLAISTSIRIGEHGLTMKRYLLVIGVIWALVVAAWYIVRRKSGPDLRLIPSFAALLFAVCSIGPWGAVGLSNINQKARVMDAIAAMDLRGADGFIKPAIDIKVPDESAHRKLSGMKYLYQHGEEKWVRAQFSQGDELFETEGETEVTRWTFNDRIARRLRMNNAGPVQPKFKAIEGIVDVSNYDGFLGRYNVHKRWTDEENANSAYTIKSSNNTVIIVSLGGKEVARFDFAKWRERLAKDGNDYLLSATPYAIGVTDGGTLAIVVTGAQSWGTALEDNYTLNVILLLDSTKPSP